MFGIDKHQNYPTKDLINIFIEYSSNDLDILDIKGWIWFKSYTFYLKKKHIYK